MIASYYRVMKEWHAMPYAHCPQCGRSQYECAGHPALDLRDRCVCHHDPSDHVPDYGPGYCVVQDCLCEGYLEENG